jgi:hypothetical protein
MSSGLNPSDLPSASIGENVLADQLETQAAEGAGHGAPVHTHCQNCGVPLSGPFCHRCGQQDLDFQRSFGHVVLEVLESFFHFDAKFFRNIATLVFQPGRLTAEFNAGRRASQMPPFRLYLFVSVLFFFLSLLDRESWEQAMPGPPHPVPAAVGAAPAGGSKPAADNTLNIHLTDKQDTPSTAT